MTIKTSRQVKDLVKNLSAKTGIKHHVLLKKYMMERFLERVSQSEYQQNFILKGGMLISSFVGIADRTTMDMDTTIKGLPVNAEDMEKVFKEISDIDIKDNVKFKIKRISGIMNEEKYPGIRFYAEALMDETVVPLVFDISTGDVITPKEINYPYKLMFEEKKIPIMSYPLETVLAEKLEAVISKGLKNTRTRDFYDIHLLLQSQKIDEDVLALAIKRTVNKRGDTTILENMEKLLSKIEKSKEMKDLWTAYQTKFEYAQKYNWETVLHSVRKLCLKAKLNVRESSALEKPKVNLKPKTTKNTKDRELER